MKIWVKKLQNGKVKRDLIHLIFANQKGFFEGIKSHLTVNQYEDFI